ncbi:hypothetical protein H310_14710 [Aphanomyces invadans]|uniref:Serine/threonine protein phosphatase 2A regulatory subunit n=1 Tax=Aphanomyces invadans TaxID=157072 RepID=A0A024T8Q1_9STRA|nr:hypothetical protein H310_14710 [Aphanomyces invadans]ETV90520.1 hypothetical protein H310_14710 [Aphanomyces invadans]|eukprot:XP_008880836.1 hypothetical protein H310_14710 [Aphanomyces invadans]
MDITALLGGRGGDDAAIQIKYECMQHLLDTIHGPAFAFEDDNVPMYMRIVTGNILRTLPLPPSSYDPDEDPPSYHPHWDFLETVYTLLVHLVEAPIPPRVIKQHITPSFVSELLIMIQSQDPRERVMVATVLHKIYAKFKSLRLHIRQEFVHAFAQYAEYGHAGYPYGMSELLEVVSSLIRGFATPLQPDHVQLLTKTLLPLLKHSFVHYHQPLLLCITDFIGKDSALASTTVEYLVVHWPKQSTAKQILFLNALEEVLECSPVDCLNDSTKAKVTSVLAKCVASVHFQVAERTLFLWNSAQLVNHSIFNPQHTKQVLPILFPSLMVAFKTHWNVTVRMLAHSVLEMYTKHDNSTYQTCLTNYKQARPA